MSKTITGDVAMLRNLLASRTSDRKVPAAVTNIREALEQAERDADVAEAKFGTADEIRSHEGVVTKLPLVDSGITQEAAITNWSLIITAPSCKGVLG